MFLERGKQKSLILLAVIKHRQHMLYYIIYANFIIKSLQEAFPVRFKGLHYLNEPTFFDVVFAIVKQFMKEKILRRVSISFC